MRRVSRQADQNYATHASRSPISLQTSLDTPCSMCRLLDHRRRPLRRLGQLKPRVPRRPPKSRRRRPRHPKSPRPLVVGQRDHPLPPSPSRIPPAGPWSTISMRTRTVRMSPPSLCPSIHRPATLSSRREAEAEDKLGAQPGRYQCRRSRPSPNSQSLPSPSLHSKWRRSPRPRSLSQYRWRAPVSCRVLRLFVPPAPVLSGRPPPNLLVGAYRHRRPREWSLRGPRQSSHTQPPRQPRSLCDMR
jgi:hypothetical protein